MKRSGRNEEPNSFWHLDKHRQIQRDTYSTLKAVFGKNAPAREDCLALAACHNGQPDRTLSAAVFPWRPEENLKHTKKNGTDKDYTTNI
ncbi:hypothetical protein TNCV_4099441 [Trichonephila clavipes]|nr:hypothetical protein TNCV_4099441 [Trichonephila clavipes]